MAASTATSLADVATVVVHVEPGFELPLPGEAMWAAPSIPPVFHDGNEVPTLNSSCDAAAYMGVVTVAQPRQFLASESLAVISVAVGGVVPVLITTTDIPTPGAAAVVDDLEIGKVVAPMQMVTLTQWATLVCLRAVGRTRLLPQSATPGDAAA